MPTKSLRNQFIRDLFPLLIIDLKQSAHRQYFIEIFQIFEILLSIVESNFRMKSSSVFFRYSFNGLSRFRSTFISTHHSIVN